MFTPPREYKIPVVKKGLLPIVLKSKKRSKIAEKSMLFLKVEKRSFGDILKKNHQGPRKGPPGVPTYWG